MKAKAFSYVRFSTPQQLKGDSQRRQLEASEKFCQEKGLELVENIQDLGIPAFRGQNKEQGALGEFLKLVKANKIEKGSFLLIENIDRLSRQKPREAFKLIEEIVDAGITLVTLQFNKPNEYSETSIEDKMLSLWGELQRAHNESSYKSERLKEAWANKRKNSDKRKLTRMCPAWLKYSEVKNKFILIPEICLVIKKIYRMKEEEKMGAGKIERELNKNKDIWKPPVTNRNKEGGWRKSYINKLLNNNLQLIGEFQPCRIEYKIEKDNEGNVKKHRIRVPDGPSIKGYFPNIFKEEEDLFYKVQEKIKINRKLKGNSGGRTGKAWNLFTHIIKCGFCNSPMHYVDKGSSSKGGQYLHCDSSQRKLWDKDEQKCNAKSIRYNDFERLFFKSIWELNFDKILPHDNEIQTHIMELKDKLDVIEYKKNQINSQKVKYTKAIGFAKTDYNIIEFLEILKALKKEDEEILKERIKFKKQIEELEDNRKRFNQNRSHYKEVYDLLESAANEEQRIKIRLQLRHQIRKLIAKIVIIPYHADKEKVYNETKQKYEELLKLLKEKSQNNYTYGKVVLNSYRNTLRNIEEDDSNDEIYGGTAVIHFNMFDSKRVLLSLMNDKLPEYLF